MPDLNPDNVAEFSVSGTCSDFEQQVVVSISNTEARASALCESGSWSVVLELTALNKMSGALSFSAQHSIAAGGVVESEPVIRGNLFVCPDGFVGVPELDDYATSSFCVAKYEMKSPVASVAAGLPQVSINRDAAIAECASLGAGYDLISNDEWQAMARNIEGVESNWTGLSGLFALPPPELLRGHSDGDPNGPLAASTDDDPCAGTLAVCDGTQWAQQRRTHTLSNREVIWDVSGNVSEWVKDTNGTLFGANAYVSLLTDASNTVSAALSGGSTTLDRNARGHFGAAGDHAALSVDQRGNLGVVFMQVIGGSVVRGANFGSFVRGAAGVFSAQLGRAPTFESPSLGFRCAFHP